LIFTENLQARQESTKEKELFDKLSIEENDHYTILLENPEIS